MKKNLKVFLILFFLPTAISTLYNFGKSNDINGRIHIFYLSPREKRYIFNSKIIKKYMIKAMLKKITTNSDKVDFWNK